MKRLTEAVGKKGVFETEMNVLRGRWGMEKDDVMDDDECHTVFGRASGEQNRRRDR